MTIEVWQPALVQAVSAWSDRSDQLDGAESNLGQAEGGCGELGPRVAPVAEAFVKTWLAEVTRLRQQADGNAQAIRTVVGQLFGVDGDTVGRMQQLLPWDERGSTPVRVGP